ncbi:hypothetical protein HF086_002281 [Spodoptera exigua]|uniref:Uncharacterized protein n=1 Tax=Spodoptera exigua TaxID=7107 RepID=A0A922MVT7_SPOEX|nr:hypothetical protein HF086_002281 [Spodoptera exigua]
MQILNDPVIPQLVTNGDMTDVVQGNAYNGFYPSTVNFNDIYSNNMAAVLGENPAPDSKDSKDKEDNADMNNFTLKFEEGLLQTQTSPLVSLPPSTYQPNTSYYTTTETTTTSSTSPASSTPTTTTEKPEEKSIRVIPIKKYYERGVLDLLFPAARLTDAYC